MTEFLRALGQIPLRMATKPGMIIEQGQQNGISPVAIVQEHTRRAVMKIQMPQRVDVVTFITAHLAALEALLGGLRPGTVRGTPALPLEKAAGFHVAPDRSIGRFGPPLGLLFDEHGEVVGMQLIAPTGMLAMLSGQQLPQWSAERRVLARVGALLCAAEPLQGPAFHSGRCNTNVRSSRGQPEPSGRRWDAATFERLKLRAGPGVGLARAGRPAKGPPR